MVSDSQRRSKSLAACTLDFAGDVVIVNVCADHRSNLFVEHAEFGLHFHQLGLGIDHRIELLWRGDSAFCPQGPSLLFAALDTTMHCRLLAFEVLIGFFQFASSFDPMLLSGQFLVQVVQLLQRPGVPTANRL